MSPHADEAGLEGNWKGRRTLASL